MKWRQAADQEWAARVAEFPNTVAGNVATLAGKCPRCDHAMTVDVEIGPVIHFDAEGIAPAGQYEVAYCNCSKAHEGRPKDSVGCGAFGAIVRTA